VSSKARLLVWKVTRRDGATRLLFCKLLILSKIEIEDRLERPKARFSRRATPEWKNEGMDQKIRSILMQMEEAGRLHDQAEPQHSEKLLNLEPETAEALVLLLTIAGVRNLLEIGTSNGYSTIWIAATLGAVGGRMVSIERNMEKYRQAQENLAGAGLSRFVDLRLGDATETVASLPGPFDCIFFDADRVSAPQQLDLLLPKLSPRALLLADNALSHPEQISGYLASVARLDQTTHLVLNVGKGLSVAFRDLGSCD